MREDGPFCRICITWSPMSVGPSLFLLMGMVNTYSSLSRSLLGSERDRVDSEVWLAHKCGLRTIFLAAGDVVMLADVQVVVLHWKMLINGVLKLFWDLLVVWGWFGAYLLVAVFELTCGWVLYSNCVTLYPFSLLLLLLWSSAGCMSLSEGCCAWALVSSCLMEEFKQ